uniref:C1q domain-containing protein n=1 Tax=Takifugu rubripes TaxID=31033 RepID=A0A674PBR2_TAKRU
RSPFSASAHTVRAAWVFMTGDKGDGGLIGPAGPLGPQGEAGECPASCGGALGPPGPQGVSGLTGARGLPGVQGLIGSKGLKGERGDEGKPGIPGLNGQKGSQGEQGGCECTDGEDGADGAVGEKGAKGEDGNPGDQGLDGRVYTAPVNGSYVFSFHLAVAGRVLKVGLFHNFSPSVRVTEGADQSTASHSVALHLTQGDRVWLQVKDATTNGMYTDGERSSTFSGYLLHPDSCGTPRGKSFIPTMKELQEEYSWEGPSGTAAPSP